MYPDIMIDIETGGLSPDVSPILQIAGVRFNLAERTVDASSMFDRCLFIPYGRHWDDGTRQWWGQQKREVLDDIYRRMEDPGLVMQTLAEWVGYDQPRFWSKPLSFDSPFIASYFRQFGIMNPFKYWTSMDMNSYIRGIANDASLERFDTPFAGGDAHNALADVLNQISNLFQASDHYEKLRNAG